MILPRFAAAFYFAVPVWGLSSPARRLQSDWSRSCSRGTAVPADGYLFCFWNAENFFDDKLDNRPHEPDKVYDAWFAEDPRAPQAEARQSHHTAALLKMNDGKGPDILALAECETRTRRRAVA